MVLLYRSNNSWNDRDVGHPIKALPFLGLSSCQKKNILQSTSRCTEDVKWYSLKPLAFHVELKKFAALYSLQNPCECHSARE